MGGWVWKDIMVFRYGGGCGKDLELGRMVFWRISECGRVNELNGAAKGCIYSV